MQTQFQVSQVFIPHGVIDLGLGDPQFSLLPLDLMHKAANDCLSQNNTDFLQYGAEQGDGPFRKSLADFLSRRYFSPVKPESLLITNGASMGLHLICTHFTHPGDTIFVEEPTYFLALRIFADHDLHLVPIRTDENGLVMESLEEELSVHHPRFLYIIPTFQNPSGQTLSLERRKNLMSLSRLYDFIVVADEVYHLLNYSSQPPRPLALETEKGNVISLGSFSKILAPGLRLGWIQANEQIIQRFVNSGLLDSGGGMNPFTSAIVGKVLETGGLDQNIAKLILIYKARMEGMDSALRHYLPGAHYALPQGGYFFWIRLPDGTNATKLQKKAELYKVRFRPGVLFSSRGGFEDYIRVSFVFYDPDELDQGLLRIKLSLEAA